MTIDRLEWLKEARQNVSYRRMYGLVVLIIGSPTSTVPERRAAEYIKGILEHVINTAIANSAVLARARIGFDRLTDIVLQTMCSKDVSNPA